MYQKYVGICEYPIRGVSKVEVEKFLEQDEFWNADKIRLAFQRRIKNKNYNSRDNCSKMFSFDETLDILIASNHAEIFNFIG